MVTLISFFVLAVVVSFVCSLSEAGLLTLRRTDVVKLKESGVWGADIVEQLKANVERSLAGILTVNTLANCFGAAGVGSAAAAIWGNSGMAAASAVLTITILVFSEIIPKTLGANYSARLAIPVAVAVRTMLFITYPIVVLMGQISKLLGSEPQRYTREDVALSARLGVADGVMVEREADVISRYLTRVQAAVSSAHTPAGGVVAFSADLTVDEACRNANLITHSHFPVYAGRPDIIVGIVRQDTILRKAQHGLRDSRLGELAQPAVPVCINETLGQAASHMQHHKCKMAVVTDEHGQYLGVVSTGDLLQQLFGKGLADLA